VHNARLMSIQKPGEMRCPSCGQSTPIAPFCSHCGAAIPSDAPIRPRGMDRDELELRSRQLRSDPRSPFRRGSEPPAFEDVGSGLPEVFVPEPEDRLIQAQPPAEDERRVDLFDEADSTGWGPPLGEGAVTDEDQGAADEPLSSWPARDRAAPIEPARVVEPVAPPPIAPPPIAPPQVAPPQAARPPVAPPSAAVAESPAPGMAFDAYQEPGRGHDDAGGYDDDLAGAGYGGRGAGSRRGRGDEPPRRGAAGPFSVIGALVLGAAAILGGALLYGILSGPPQTASASPTPTAAATLPPTGTPSIAPSGAPSGGATATPAQTGTAVASGTPAPDNFTAKVQPCATSEMTFQGCTQDGSTINGTRVWVWVGFYQAQYNDVIGVTLLQGGSPVADGSAQLQQDNIGCKPNKTCTGYLNFNFGALAPGDYTIKVSRNGADAADTSFTAS
jgi:hypothetical protein